MPFFFNPDREPVDHAENLLWFHNYTTKADGKVAGNGANDGLIRTVTQGKEEAVKSMVLVDMKTNGESLQQLWAPTQAPVATFVSATGLVCNVMSQRDLVRCSCTMALSMLLPCCVFSFGMQQTY
jgi:hypothetical protein